MTSALDGGPDLCEYRRRVYTDWRFKEMLRALGVPQTSVTTMDKTIAGWLLDGTLLAARYRPAHWVSGDRFRGLRVLNPEPILAWTAAMRLTGDPDFQAGKAIGGK
jgi:hypothetical protein